MSLLSSSSCNKKANHCVFRPFCVVSVLKTHIFFALFQEKGGAWPALDVGKGKKERNDRREMNMPIVCV